MSARGDRPSSVRDAEALLESVAENTIDEYEVVRDGPPQRSAQVMAGAVVAFFGLLLTVAAVQARLDRPATEAERSALIENIRVRTELVQSRRETVAQLQEEIAGLDATDTSGDPEAQSIRIATGDLGVDGPGVVVTLRSSDEEMDGGVVTDTDLKLAVNGLWLAGAEAIAVNGQRIGPLTAIRSAGGAILVNYRPIEEPYVVEAIGPERMATYWSSGPSGRYVASRSKESGIRFAVQGSESLSLPAVPAARLRLSTAEVAK